LIDSLDPWAYVPFDIYFVPSTAGDVSITATISGDQSDPSPYNNTAVAPFQAIQPIVADLTVALKTSKPAVFNLPLTYDITVTNNGPDAASGVTAYDPLPPGVTFGSATASQGGCFGGEWGALSCYLGSLAANASATVKVVVMPSMAGTIDNSVSVSNYGYLETDPDYSNNSASSSVTVRGPTGTPVGHSSGGCGLWPAPRIDDLEDGNISLGPKNSAGWFIFNDGTGTQVPGIVDGLIVRGGPGKSRYMAQSSGDGFQFWGAGFGVAFGCSYDVSRFHGVRFAAKAGGMRSVFVEVPTIELVPVEFGGRCVWNCNDFYNQRITLADDAWYDCTVAFGDLAQIGWGMQAPLDLGAVTGVQFNFGLADIPFDLSVDNLEFVTTAVHGSSCVRIGG
jgi:uncharacterized repeat protein (TIGR01451 family)